MTESSPTPPATSSASGGAHPDDTIAAADRPAAERAAADDLAAKRPAGIDPRGPRFGAGITALALLVAIALSLSGAAVAGAVLLAVISALFAWGAFAGIRVHPYGLFFAKVVRPHLKPAGELEDPAPPTFAQGVGLVVTLIGLILFAVGVPLAVPIAAAAAFVAAFLNSVFAFCLGCQLYLLLVRARVIHPSNSIHLHPHSGSAE